MTASCNFGEVEVFDVPPLEEHDPVLEFLAADESAAGALGWAEGRIPDAQIRIVADDSAGNPWRFEGTTGADGRIELEGVPAAQYVVTTFRLLDESERASLQENGTVAFVGTALVRLDGTTEPRTVTVPASERRALVISEFEFDVPDAGGSHLIPAGYIELYNNADTTIYLDGKLIARSYHVVNDYSTRPCWMFDHMRADAAELYAAAFERFPGSGRDYPLLPGQTAVVAVDGIDHRPFSPHAFDLSGADFEFRGAGDVDNPAVPNMINVGIREGTPMVWPGLPGRAWFSCRIRWT